MWFIKYPEYPYFQHRILWLRALLGKGAFCTCHLKVNFLSSVITNIFLKGFSKIKFILHYPQLRLPIDLFCLCYVYHLFACSVSFFTESLSFCARPSTSKPINLLKSLFHTKGSLPPLESGRKSMNICFNLVQRCPIHLHHTILGGTYRVSLAVLSLSIFSTCYYMRLKLHASLA